MVRIEMVRLEMVRMIVGLHKWNVSVIGRLVGGGMLILAVWM